MRNTSSQIIKPVSPAQTANAFFIPDPKMVLGVALIVFGFWLMIEGVLMASVGQFVIAAVFLLFGWWYRKRGVSDLNKVSLWGWMRFWALAVPALFAAYVLGYFVLMDRHTPTFPAGSAVRFESTLRCAPYEWMDKAVPPYQTKWKSVTTWNILYKPMDRFWFQHFPRSQEEVERLRKMGYYRN
jgi:hypothetical protein